MKIMVVHVGFINEYPPVLSLILNFLEHQHKVMIIAYDCEELPETVKNNENLCIYNLKRRSYTNIMHTVFDLIRERKNIKKTIKANMPFYDILWTTTDKSARDIGNQLFQYKHVMQLMELIEYIPLVGRQKVFKSDISKYARAAWKVVVPEYNRAHIQKAWWGLERLPEVLPNKPYQINLDSDCPEKVKKELEMISQSNKKIILYQGVFDNDRKLDIYAQAIQELKNEYSFCIMGRENAISDELIKRYPFIHVIPFIKPPYHLHITSRAYIGILPYQAGKNCGNNSILNGIYCAPNKIFEYGAFGIPMLGSDVPGLKFIFDQYQNGISCKFDKVQIQDALVQIEKNYNRMKENSYKYYDSVDLDKIVQRIIYEEQHQS